MAEGRAGAGLEPQLGAAVRWGPQAGCALLPSTGLGRERRVLALSGQWGWWQESAGPLSSHPSSRWPGVSSGPGEQGRKGMRFT